MSRLTAVVTATTLVMAPLLAASPASAQGPPATPPDVPAFNAVNAADSLVAAEALGRINEAARQRYGPPPRGRQWFTLDDLRVFEQSIVVDGQLSTRHTSYRGTRPPIRTVH